MDVDELVDRGCESILREHARAMKGLADSIRAIPEEEWTQGERPGDVPVRQACHLLLYACGKAGNVGARFGVPVESFHKVVAREGYPPREAVLGWIPEVEDRIGPWVRGCMRKALTGARKGHSPMNKPIYLLRHTVVHLAYLRREMYKRGIPRPRY